MQRIMLATDFSERSDRALRRAVLLARESGARLDLVHVVDDDRPRRFVERDAAEARQWLSDLAGTLESGDKVACGTQVISADPFVGLAKAVKDAAPDLLVIGPHRRQILRDAFSGTTVERTIRAVNCPVLMVNGPPIRSYRKVLLTTDLSDGARNAVQRFREMQIEAEEGAGILHVFDAPALRLAAAAEMAKDSQDAYLADHRAEAARGLAEFMAGFAPGVPNRSCDVGKRPSPVIS